MKKLFAVALFGLAAVSGWAQGTVDFRVAGVGFAMTADRLVYLGSVAPENRLVGTNYVAGLWFGPGAGNTTVDKTGGTQAGRTFNFRPATTSSPGTWTPGANPFIFTLEGTTLNTTVTLQVRVWDSVRYNSFASALAAGNYGVSTPFDYLIPTLGSSPDKYYMEGLRAFVVTVPEPSTIALAVLGVAGLLFLRRRK
jgi:hypothetical protein